MNSTDEEDVLVINPDTLWNENYNEELKFMEKKLLQEINCECILLVVDKEKSFVDPVCGMVVKSNNKISLEFKNKYFYFCCNGCRSKFKNNPEFYLEKT